MVARLANLWIIYVTAWVWTGWARKRREAKRGIKDEG